MSDELRRLAFNSSLITHHYFLRLRSLPQKLRHVQNFNVARAPLRADAVLQHRHAEGAADRHHVRARLDGLPRALPVDAPARRLFDETHAAAPAATETLVAAALHLHGPPARGDFHEAARRVVDAVLPPEVTGVVKGYLLINVGARPESALFDQTREVLAVVIDLEAAAVVRVLVLEGVEAVRAGGDDFPDAVPVQVPDVLLSQRLEQKLVADAPRRVAGALLLAPHDGEAHAGLREQLRRRARHALVALDERAIAADPQKDFGVRGVSDVFDV